MLDRFRIPLLLLSGVVMLWGSSLFWNGKTVADTERKNRKPLSLTRDDLLTNPPKTAITWVRLKDGNGSLSRAVRVQSGTKRSNELFLLYVPIVSPREAADSLTMQQLAGESPDYSVMLRTTDKKHKAVYDAMKPLESSPERTADAWIKQNRDALTLHPPYTGLLVRRGFDPYAAMISKKSGFAEDGYVLWENETPPIVASAPVAGGLALLMGVPTLWIFGLLITGKFDPPDDDAQRDTPESTVSESTPPTDTPGRVTIPAPIGSVMPSASPGN